MRLKLSRDSWKLNSGSVFFSSSFQAYHAPHSCRAANNDLSVPWVASLGSGNGFVPFEDAPIADDAVQDKSVTPRELLGCLTGSKDTHSALLRVGEGADHQQRALDVEFRDARAVGRNVGWGLRPNVVSGFVEQHVFHNDLPQWTERQSYQDLLSQP